MDYHKRTVLAAEIVFQSEVDNSLGHLKLQKLMWNYEIYEIGSKVKEKGKADLIEFERLLPPYLHLTVSKNKHTKPFKLEMIKGLTVYKVWR